MEYPHKLRTITSDNLQLEQPPRGTLDTKPMELSNSDVIETLYRSPAQPRQAVAAPKIPRRAIAKRCQCGQCAACRDNARWERIFQEKFADPNYYSLRPLWQRSTLHGLG
jgi:hypothetical protein